MRQFLSIDRPSDILLKQRIKSDLSFTQTSRFAYQNNKASNKRSRTVGKQLNMYKWEYLGPIVPKGPDELGYIPLEIWFPGVGTLAEQKVVWKEPERS